MTQPVPEGILNIEGSPGTGRLLLKFADGSLRYHYNVPGYMIHELMVLPQPQTYYDSQIRFVYPQVSTQALGYPAGALFVELAATTEIQDGDTLVFVPHHGKTFQAVVTSVSLLPPLGVTIADPLPFAVAPGLLVIDLQNQT